jgi:hypothetical protein
MKKRTLYVLLAVMLVCAFVKGVAAEDIPDMVCQELTVLNVNPLSLGTTKLNSQTLYRFKGNELYLSTPDKKEYLYNTVTMQEYGRFNSGNKTIIFSDMKSPNGIVIHSEASEVRVSKIRCNSATQQKVDTKPSETVSPRTVGQDISGEWHVVDSDARFKIFFVDGDIRIEGWDNSDGEKFRISDVQWDGKRLQGIFVMPSTKGTTYSNLALIDTNTLKGAYRGDSSGEEVWRRQSTIAAPTLTGSATQQKIDTKPSETVSPRTVGQDISGEWHVVDSTARFKIFFVDGNIQIEGGESSDGEKFRISDVQWDGKKLNGIFVMPSKNNTRYLTLLLIDANTLKGAYKGDSSGGEVWKRQ